MKLIALHLVPLAGLALLAPATAQVTNIAPGGVASQSTTWAAEAPARDAIDGNTDTSWWAGSVQHTDSTFNSWWRVDFQSAYEMLEVRLHNRGDCGFCGPRLSNFRVSVLDGAGEVWGEDFYVGAGSVPLGGIEVIPLPAGTVGSTVRVQFIGWNNSGNGYMHMSEVEVDGREVGATFCVSNPNSTGMLATIRGIGSNLVANNNFSLIVSGLPANQYGYFLASPNPGGSPTPTSVGVLCLGGPFARFSATVLQTPDNGDSVGTGIDLTAIPMNPTTAVLPGQSWHFQYWFRDSVGISNFSNGLRVTFL